MKRVLLNSHRKLLHDQLVQEQIDPALVNWTNDSKKWTSDPVETLEIGLCYFVISAESDGKFTAKSFPGTDGGAPEGRVNLSLQELGAKFRRWAFYVAKELRQPDPWSQYSAYVPPERITDSSDNTPFTHAEAEQVIEAVKRLQQYIRVELPQYTNAADRFDPQFDRLKEQAATGLGRIDWRNQFVGFLISMFLALGLAPEQASVIWKFWIHLIGQLLLPP